MGVRRRVVGKLAVLVAALVSAGAMVAGPANAGSSRAAVTQLGLSSRDSIVYADWTPSVDTASADVCWKQDVAPVVVDDPAATCSGNMSASGFSFEATEGTTYGLSVFAYDEGTASYGDPTSGTVT